VAFPGGRAEEADSGDDEVTAARETQEEVGIDLLDGSWSRLGRITDDRVIYPGGRPLTVSLFGFFHSRPGSPPSEPTLPSKTSEVEFAWWVPTSTLVPASLCWRETPLEELVADRGNLAQKVLRMTRARSLRFAAITLPAPPPPASVDTPVLWGLTLAFTSDMLSRACGTPLVGRGAPPEWASAFRSSGGSLADAVLMAALEGQRLRAVARAYAPERGGAVVAAGAAALALAIAAVVSARRAKGEQL
jgi:ADP-ribose pyrophosphatase YjhB (NUDIX family)